MIIQEKKNQKTKVKVFLKKQKGEKQERQEFTVNMD